MQLEFFKLAQLTGRPEFYDKAAAVFTKLDANHLRAPPLGTASGGRLWPLHVSPTDAKLVGNSVSFGAMGDSFYEYTLKVSLERSVLFSTLAPPSSPPASLLTLPPPRPHASRHG